MRRHGALIEVVLVEDNERYRHELGMLLAGCKDLEVVGQYTKGSDAVTDILEKRPDVVLIDIDLPDISGIDVIKKVLSEGCATEFLVLSVYDDDDHLFSALQAGALGYIVKGSTSIPELEQAIHEVIDGGAPMSRSIAKRVLATFRSKSPKIKHTRFDDLTKREKQILELLTRGYTAKKIANDLCISYETVRTHIKNIYQKLQVHSLMEAMALYNKES